MAGETAKCEALCLAIHPWSRTSHVVKWLTPFGLVSTVVKGAVRPKSGFLGQYDLNYVCEIVYYLRERGNLHALRECAPLKLREGLRGSFRALALADYVRAISGELAGDGLDSGSWFGLCDGTIGVIENHPPGKSLLPIMLRFDLEALRLSGIAPDFSGYDPSCPWSSFSLAAGAFASAGEGRHIRIRRETARCLCALGEDEDDQNLLDATRVIGVFYQFHLDCAVETRREVLKLILHNDNEKAKTR
jgi:recombinational DNA repair protein (RecF pathway)